MRKTLLSRISVRAAVLPLMLLTGSAAAVADTPLVLDLSAGSGEVTFLAIGNPSALKVKGKGTAAKGRLEVKDGKASGTATFDLSTLDTGIKLRTEHMKRKYLELEKHPEAMLTLSGVSVPERILKDTSSEGEGPFEGKFSVHGKEALVSGTLKLMREGETLSGTVEFGTTISAHEIGLPSFMGVTLADKIDVTVRFEAPFKK